MARNWMLLETSIPLIFPYWPISAGDQTITFIMWRRWSKVSFYKWRILSKWRTGPSILQTGIGKKCVLKLFPLSLSLSLSHTHCRRFFWSWYLIVFMDFFFQPPPLSSLSHNTCGFALSSPSVADWNGYLVLFVPRWYIMHPLKTFIFLSSLVILFQISFESIVLILSLFLSFSLCHWCFLWPPYFLRPSAVQWMATLGGASDLIFQTRIRHCHLFGIMVVIFVQLALWGFLFR